MSDVRLIDLGTSNIEVKDDEIPVSLIYFGKVEVRDWEELFFIAVKCLYMEFPDVITKLCSKDPKRILFLRTTTIDMKHPRRVAPIIFLETKRTPRQIIQALLTIFHFAGVVNIRMKIEVAKATAGDFIDLEKMFPSSIFKKDADGNFHSAKQNFQPQNQIQNPYLPKFSLDQSIDEMIAALDATDPRNFSPPKKFPVEKKAVLKPSTFGNLFFILNGKHYGPFANEKYRYVALMRCLAEFFPDEMLKQAGRHINSKHRLTLMHGQSYLYFREPVMLPNDLFTDKGFPDIVLMENEKYYLEKCGLTFESVMRQI